MRILSLSLAFLVAFAGGLTAQETDKVTIEWKFKKGDTFRYEMNMNMDITMGGMEIAQEMLMGQAFEVTDVSADGTGSLKITYDRMKFKMDGPMAVDFDSDKDKKAEDVFGSIFGAMVGKSLTMQMSRKGEITKIEGMAKLVEDIIASLPEEHQAMAGMFKGQMTDDYVKSMAQSSFGFLPKAPVAKGETWEFATKTVVAAVGKADLSGKSTLKEVREGKEAVISQDSKMEFKGGEEGPMGAAEISPTRTKGEMIWLLGEGRMKSSKSTATMEFTAQGAESSMTVKMEMKLAPRPKPAEGTKTESGKGETPKEPPATPPKKD